MFAARVPEGRQSERLALWCGFNGQISVKLLKPCSRYFEVFSLRLESVAKAVLFSASTI